MKNIKVRMIKVQCEFKSEQAQKSRSFVSSLKFGAILVAKSMKERNKHEKCESWKRSGEKNENVKYEKLLESEKCGAAEVESPRMADAAFQQN